MLKRFEDLSRTVRNLSLSSVTDLIPSTGIPTTNGQSVRRYFG